MKFLLVGILLISVTLAGCSTVRTYTFKKERVDQKIEGNRGYIMGTPPPAPVEREVPKRTLIGVDVEIPILPLEEVELPPKKGVVEEETVTVEEEITPEIETQEEVIYEPGEEERPAPIQEEEEWIK